VKRLLLVAALMVLVAGCSDNDKPPTQAKGKVDKIKTTDGPGAK
jgi:PBP1b-binding outer membrane lipoprotein LpoB